MVILGVDPGLAIVGYGIVESENGNFKMVDYGSINTPKDETLPVRLAMIEQGLIKLIETYKPDCIAVEELFFYKNVTTAIAVAEARGVILLTGIKHCGKLYEYTPMQIKQAITGYGGADKRQIQQMVKLLLKLKTIPKPDDAADALAIALTHAQTNRLSEQFKVR